MIEIAVEDVRTGLKALVDEKGADFVYEPKGADAVCVYVHDGKPDCIVGQFLAAQGVPLERLEKADRCGLGYGGIQAAALMEQLTDENIIRAPWAVSEALRKAQFEQDHHKTWGAALEAALEVLDNS